jgi:hypothetical protein
MANDVLVATKDFLGIPADETSFDAQLVSYINLALFTLNDLGVGEEGYQTSLTEGTWEDFISDEALYSPLQMYIGFKVRLSFDPPTSSFVVTSLENQIKELEFRLLDRSSES